MVWKYNVTIVWSQNICMYIFLVLIKNVTNIFLNVEILITELICIKFYVCILDLCCTLLIMLILCCPAPFKIHFLLYSLVFLLHLFFLFPPHLLMHVKGCILICWCPQHFCAFSLLFVYMLFTFIMMLLVAKRKPETGQLILDPDQQDKLNLIPLQQWGNETGLELNEHFFFHVGVSWFSPIICQWLSS